MKRFVFECSECGNVKFSDSSTTVIRCLHHEYSTRGVIGPYTTHPNMTLIGSITIDPIEP